MSNTKQDQDTAVLTTLARDIHTEMGGRATTEDVARIVIQRAPDLHTSITWSTFRGMVGKALSRHDSSGLPFAASIDNAGTYLQRSLFDVSDYEVVIGRYADRVAANIEIARGLSTECSDFHGVTIDVDSMIRQAAGL